MVPGFRLTIRGVSGTVILLDTVFPVATKLQKPTTPATQIYMKQVKSVCFLVDLKYLQVWEILVEIFLSISLPQVAV